jgi:hypothetical protein
VDILAFLKDRTTFIREFYKIASSPFRETMRKIEAGEPPFEPHLANYEDEPPFTTEWIEANTSLEVLGRVCVSMLSAGLKLYFNTWCSHLHIETQQSEQALFKNGFLDGHKRLLGGRLGIEWSECPADFAVIEQVILARIRDQHPDSITRQSVSHRREDLAKFAHLFFMSETDQKIFADPELAGNRFFSFSVHVTAEKLLSAIREVEALAEWLEPRLIEHRWPRGPR